ncbi:hypothetical protein CDAR_95311 [Caerostris darwini]|uniref:Uncharacterized protein n=1 Tax=Caerostris darwini TaxID=1538125 RepID=A0AAV4PIB3_9ARAC|nr:hypothetical protein CDAR_95311 [Caerostris darwini]
MSLQYGANMIVHNRSHGIPLTYVCCKGSSACIKLLLKMDADVPIPKNGRTPLHEICLYDKVEMCRDINALGIILQTPLHDACYAGSIDCTELRLKRGADVQTSLCEESS